MRSRALLPSLAAASAVALLCATACREPTEIVVDVSTDLTCPQPLTATVTAAAPEALEAHDVSSTAYACDPSTSRIGSVVVVPSGSKDSDIAVRVVLGVDSQADQCKPENHYQGCIVARRELNFLPGATVHLPIVMHGDCKNVPCDQAAGETCFHGTCVSSKIESTQCSNGICDEGQLGPLGDGGAGDGSFGDGASDAGEGGVTDGSRDGAGGDGSPPVDGGTCGTMCTPTTLAVGLKHTCILKGGGVECIGAQDYGQLGNGVQSPTADQDSMQSVLTSLGKLTGVKAIYTGPFHSCAIKTDATVWCWGDDEFGQIGAPGAAITYASQVSEMTGATSLALGYAFSCWVDGQSNVKCMGSGIEGELGTGVTSGAQGPAQVNVGGPVQSLIAGPNSVCATLMNGSRTCWGSNAFGALEPTSMATTTYPTPHPSQVFAGTNAIALGSITSCAINADRSVSCWGNDNEGQAGVSPEADAGEAASKIKLPSGGSVAGATQITIADDPLNDDQSHIHVCVLLDTQKVVCWGSHAYGQLGNGDYNQDVLVPSSPVAVEVYGLANVQVVAAGGNHSCALANGGALYCWGRNSDSQLGPTSHLMENGTVPTVLAY